MDDDIGQMAMMYVGYKDKTFVPFRLLKNNDIYTDVIEDEKYVRAALCITQKIGNGAEGCTLITHPGLTKRWRREGRLRRNHYIYEVIANIKIEEMPLFDKVAARKLGHGADNSGAEMLDTSKGQACELGFCD